MTCAKNCNTQDVQLVFASLIGTFTITVWDDQEAFIQYDGDTTPINIKRDSLGNVFAAGHNYVIRPFTIFVPCSDEAKAMDAAWKKSPIEMCGSLQLITNCCNDEFYESIRLTTVNAPNIGTEIGVYSFSFEGVIK